MANQIEPLLEVNAYHKGNRHQSRSSAIIHRQVPESLISEGLQQTLGLPLLTEAKGKIIDINGENLVSIGTVKLVWQVYGGRKTRTTMVHVVQRLPVDTDLIFGDELLSSDTEILQSDDGGVHVLVMDKNPTPEAEVEIQRRAEEQREREARIALRQQQEIEASKRKDDEKDKDKQNDKDEHRNQEGQQKGS